jgi:hypothetical protein
MIVTRISPLTGKENSMDLPITQFAIDLWKNGMLIQDAMPHLTDSEREFIKTGITEDEWNNLFQESEND